MPPIVQISRRTFLAGLTLLPLATACGMRQAQQETLTGPQDGPRITVYKSPT